MSPGWFGLPEPSRPLTGAWIETLVASTGHRHPAVALSRGRGSKPEVRPANRGAERRPLTGAWIALKDSTLVQYRADLDRRLGRLLATQPPTPTGRKLVRAVKRCRSDLFVFVTRRDVPSTNNGCERALRPSVIFRKVTGCFRSRWGTRLYAAAISVIATGRLNGTSALQAITDALKPVAAPALQ